jgi:hypothetical protein
MKKMFSLNMVVLACASLSLLAFGSGCATATRGASGAPRSSFVSRPDGAAIYDQSGQFMGKTPFSEALSPRKELTFVAKMQGFADKTVISTPHVDLLGGTSMFAGDTFMLAACPPVGAVAYGVDWATKKSKAHPKQLMFEMTPIAPDPYSPPVQQQVYYPPQPAPIVMQPAPQQLQPVQTVVVREPEVVVYHAPAETVTTIPCKDCPEHNLPVASNSGNSGK